MGQCACGGGGGGSWWCYPEDGIKTQDVHEVRTGLGVQVESGGLWGGKGSMGAGWSRGAPSGAFSSFD